MKTNLNTMKSIIFGAVSGAILGLLEMLILGGSFDLIIIPAIVGVLIAMFGAKVPGVGFWGACAVVGAVAFLVGALISGYAFLDHAIMGAITGLLVGVVMKFITPLIIK